MTGTEVKAEVVERIEARLAAVNGNRRVRRLTAEDVVRQVGKVQSQSGPSVPWASVHGGSVAASYRQDASTSFVLVARVGGKLRIGFAEADAHGPTAGRAFAALQPWRKPSEWPAVTRGGPAGDAASKWAAWASSADVLTLEDPEVDAILGAE